MSNPFAGASNPFASASFQQPPTADPNEPLAPAVPGGGLVQPPPQRSILFFHVFFKALALLCYLGSSTVLGGSYVLTFVLVTMLSAFDFWTVKNVSGRLLVGLRWWNTIDDNGESKWHFESHEDQRYTHPTDSNIFWLVLFVAPAIWLLLALTCVFTLRVMWLLLVLVAFTCNMINVVGYVQCKRDAGKKLTALGGTVLHRGFEIAQRVGFGSRATAAA